MDIRVHGKNLKIEDDLRALVEDKVSRAEKIFDAVVGADIEFTENTNPRLADEKFRVEVTSQVAGQVLRVEASAGDERTALDRAVEKYERQVRKIKERLQQRSRRANKTLNAAPPVSDDSDETDGPTIVRVKRFAIKPMTPEEAALQMEMLGHSFFFFVNAETGDHSVLYRRRDGSLGLIEAE